MFFNFTPLIAFSFGVTVAAAVGRRALATWLLLAVWPLSKAVILKLWGASPWGGMVRWRGAALETGRDAKVYFHWIRVHCVKSNTYVSIYLYECAILLSVNCPVNQTPDGPEASTTGQQVKQVLSRMGCSVLTFLLWQWELKNSSKMAVSILWSSWQLWPPSSWHNKERRSTTAPSWLGSDLSIYLSIYLSICLSTIDR